jgi:hypothetical protein
VPILILAIILVLALRSECDGKDTPKVRIRYANWEFYPAQVKAHTAMVKAFNIPSGELGILEICLWEGRYRYSW